MNERLDAIGGRIERVALAPDQIESQTFFRVARPLYALAGWRAKVRYAALEALVAALRATRDGDDPAHASRALDAALVELEENVSTVERAAILRRRPPVAYAAWLRRAWELVARASGAIESMAAGARDEAVVRGLAHVDPVALLPPLALRKETGAGEEPGSVAELPTKQPLPESEADARVVELELAAIDRLLEAARAERGVLGRRRRLLVAARQRLLEACAALPVDPAGARGRAEHVAREIARIDRFENAGLSVTSGLVHQARLAVARGDPRLAYSAMAALEGAALSGDDARVATLTARAIARLSGDSDPRGAAAREASLRQSALDLLGADVVSGMNEAIANGRAAAKERLGAALSPEEHELARLEAKHFQAGSEQEVARSAVAVDGCFEVGGALAPLRVLEEEHVLRPVRYPTQDLLLVPARDVEDFPDAIIGDPRTILLDLAAGRLLSRRHMLRDTQRTSRVVLRSEVRVYLLDGSGSMTGPRARVRDALLLAELATTIARLKSPRATRCTLLYRYFDRQLGPVTRVDSVASAHAAVRDVVGTMRSGGTDIHRALVASLEQIAEARELDPDLASAQIVLVTDGEAPVEEEAIAAARAATAGLPIGVSVIALGQENPALRDLVARQRAKGERAFYHFVDDAQLSKIADGTFDEGLAVHLAKPKQTGKGVARDLEQEIGPIVDELAAIERQRDLEALDALDTEAQARREAGIVDGGNEGDRARVEALNRDRAALNARYERWFPEPSAPSARAGAGPEASGPERDDVDAVSCVLASVAEVVSLIGGGELARRADAIELLERLLPDAHLTPARYRSVLREHPAQVASSLRALRAIVQGAEGHEVQ